MRERIAFLHNSHDVTTSSCLLWISQLDLIVNAPVTALHDDSLSGPAPSMGRITGSASIETLVRVGIEKENGLGPEAKMVVLHDFTPCVDDELEVKRGQVGVMTRVIKPALGGCSTMIHDSGHLTFF